MTRRYALLKRGVDLVAVLLVAPLVVPVAVLCAIAVRLDSPGPVIYGQRRTGRNGEPFRMYKFRTMVRNADELKEQLRHLSVVPAPDFKVPNDPRITRVGKHLRATSLDELPQLWNVVRGDMSIVGPRPTSFAPGTREYRLWHTRRLEARPGLTGLWQIEGRTTTDFDERIRLDDRYIRTASLRTDLAIIARTVPALIRREGS